MNKRFREHAHPACLRKVPIGIRKSHVRIFTLGPKSDTYCSSRYLHDDGCVDVGVSAAHVRLRSRSRIFGTYQPTFNVVTTSPLEIQGCTLLSLVDGVLLQNFEVGKLRSHSFAQKNPRLRRLDTCIVS